MIEFTTMLIGVWNCLELSCQNTNQHKCSLIPQSKRRFISLVHLCLSACQASNINDDAPVLIIVIISGSPTMLMRKVNAMVTALFKMTDI